MDCGIFAVLRGVEGEDGACGATLPQSRQQWGQAAPLRLFSPLQPLSLLLSFFARSQTFKQAEQTAQTGFSGLMSDLQE